VTTGFRIDIPTNLVLAAFKARAEYGDSVFENTYDQGTETDYGTACRALVAHVLERAYGKCYGPVSPYDAGAEPVIEWTGTAWHGKTYEVTGWRAR
jgi:hypothetical protein